MDLDEMATIKLDEKGTIVEAPSPVKRGNKVLRAIHTHTHTHTHTLVIICMYTPTHTRTHTHTHTHYIRSI